jgi:hypothetical protein
MDVFQVIAHHHPGAAIAGRAGRLFPEEILMLRQYLVGVAATGCNIAIHALVMVVVKRRALPMSWQRHIKRFD